MDSSEIWKEICFLLSESVKPDIPEKDYESQVVRAVEALGWKQYTGEIKRQPVLRIGNKMKIRPDLLICGSDGNPVIVVEVKRPAERLSKEQPADQLISYMLQTKAEFGLLIGNSIRLFYDGKGNPQRKPLLLDRIPFETDSKKGLDLVSIFQKTDFLKKGYKNLILKLIKEFTDNRNIKKLREALVANETKSKIFDFLKDEYSDYGSDVVEGALNGIIIELSFESDDEEVGMATTPPLSPPQKSGSLLKTVFEAVKLHKDGIRKNELVQLTGFTDKQINNLLYKLTKRMAVETNGKGVYSAISKTVPAKNKKIEKSKSIKPFSLTEGTIRHSVFEEIKKFPDGCTSEHLKSNLELDGKQLSNVLYKLTTKGFIQSAGHGIYIVK